MAVNDLSFNQLSTVLGTILGQAQGTAPITSINTSNFVSVAQKALLTGYDPLMTAVSQVLSKTIFSVRPYKGKLASLQVDNVKYGNHVRKLQTVDKPFEEDSRLTLVDGESVDQQKVNKPNVVQTNFYGANQYQKTLTIFKDQLDCAFSSAEEFGRFISMIMTNASDMIEQAREATRRATLINLIAGTSSDGKSTQIVHCLSEYNAAMGTELVKADIFKTENYTSFVQWLFARIMTVSQLFTERSAVYHRNIGNDVIMRHTPYRMQKIYMLNEFMNAVATKVFSTVFNAEYLQKVSFEGVNFWQDIQKNGEVQATPSKLNNDGNVSIGTGQTIDLIGVIFDEEAAGVTSINQWSATAPFNAKGGYTNMFWHFTERYWNDFSENCVIFTFD